MIEVRIVNKIEEKINEKKIVTGVTKSFIAEQIGISRQSLNILCKTPNPTIESLVKVSIAIGCDVTDLFEYEIVK